MTRALFDAEQILFALSLKFSVVTNDFQRRQSSASKWKDKSIYNKELAENNERFGTEITLGRNRLADYTMNEALLYIY